MCKKLFSPQNGSLQMHLDTLIRDVTYFVDPERRIGFIFIVQHTQIECQAAPNFYTVFPIDNHPHNQ